MCGAPANDVAVIEFRSQFVMKMGVCACERVREKGREGGGKEVEKRTHTREFKLEISIDLECQCRQTKQTKEIYFHLLRSIVLGPLRNASTHSPSISFFHAAR